MQDLKWGRLLVMAVTVFVLGTFAIWYEFSLKGKREEKEKQAKKVFNLKDNAVSSVTLNDSGRTFTFKCQDVEAKLCKTGDNSKWKVTQPVELKADDSNVNALLSTLNNLQPNETIDLSPETPEKRSRLLKEYLLDEAGRSRKDARKVLIQFVDGSSRGLVLGDQHPVGDVFFAGTLEGEKFDDQKVLLIPSYFKSNFERELIHWRDKKLLSVASHQVVALDVAMPKGNYRAEKKDGMWQLRAAGAKDSVPGDSESVDNMLSALGYLTAKSFASEKKSDPKAKGKLAGSPQVLSVRLEFEKGADGKATLEPVTVQLFQSKSNAKAPLFATVSTNDPLYELDPGARDRLSKDIKELRLSKLLTSTDRFAAKKIKISGPSAMTVVQKEGKWLKEGGGEMAQEKVTTLLDRMSGNRIRDFLKSAPAGENEGIRIELFDDKDKELRSYVFWRAKAAASAPEAKDGLQLFARIKNETQEVVLVDKSLQDALPWKAGHFDLVAPTPTATAKADAP
jgi:hypothetical protein